MRIFVLSLLLSFIFSPLSTVSPSLRDQVLAPQSAQIKSSINIRADITLKLQESLKSENPDHLEKLVWQSTRSIMDYNLFLLILSQTLYEQPQYFQPLEQHLKKLVLKYEHRDDAFIIHLLAILNSFKQKNFNPHSSYFSEDNSFYHFNPYLTSGGEFFPVELDETHLTYDEAQAAVETLLKENRNWVLKSLQKELQNKTLTLEDIELPIRVLHLQGGRFEHIYSIFVKLKQADQWVAFALALATNATDKSAAVFEEYQHFLAHQDDPDLVKVYEVTKVLTAKGEVVAYSSHLFNTSEVVYAHYGHPVLMERPLQLGHFILNSVIPYNRKVVLSYDDSLDFVSKVVGWLVRYYNPDKKTMIKDFSLSAGDANLDLSTLSLAPEKKMLLEKREGVSLKLKRIAWRGTQTDVSHLDFLDYLFNFTWLENDSERLVPLHMQYLDPELISMAKEMQITQTKDLIQMVALEDRLNFGSVRFLGTPIVRGLLKGFVTGLEKEMGKEQGRKTAIQWLRQYLDATHAGTYKPVLAHVVIADFLQFLQNQPQISQNRTNPVAQSL